MVLGMVIIIMMMSIELTWRLLAWTRPLEIHFLARQCSPLWSSAGWNHNDHDDYVFSWYATLLVWLRWKRCNFISMVEMKKMSWITQKFPIYIDRGHFGPNRPISKMLRQDAKFLPHSQHFKQSQRLVKSSLYLPQVGDWKNDIAMICSFFFLFMFKCFVLFWKKPKCFGQRSKTRLVKFLQPIFSEIVQKPPWPKITLCDFCFIEKELLEC